MSEEIPIRIGISSCLLGERVRYDGDHKRNSVLTGLTGPIEWIEVCPEVESGMGVPREPVRLVASPAGTLMVGTESGTDYTPSVSEYIPKRLEELAERELSGYVLKSRSPSCGLDGVPIQGSDETGSGLFAAALVERFPALPVAEENDLEDPSKREGFFERVHAYRRIRDYLVKERSVGQLAMFHAQSRLQLEAHTPGGYEQMSRVFAEGAGLSYFELGDQYLNAFMKAIAEPVPVARHFDMLRQIVAELKGTVDPGALKEIALTVQEYKRGNAPLAAPVVLIRNYVRLHDLHSLNGQTYLEPGPGELILRTRH
jgi:uncharacterized protein YbbK (DUF523 family)/uncharacterized protein YbgA (DUF1722 family)